MQDRKGSRKGTFMLLSVAALRLQTNHIRAIHGLHRIQEEMEVNAKRLRQQAKTKIQMAQSGRTAYN